MTSYAAFYIGRDDNAEWLGTVRGHDIRRALIEAESAHQALDATDEDSFRAAVAELLPIWEICVDSSYAPDESAPNDYSGLADLAYAFDDGQVWIRHTRAGSWEPAPQVSMPPSVSGRAMTGAEATDLRGERRYRMIRGTNVDYRVTYYNTQAARDRAAQCDADRHGQPVQREWVFDGTTEPHPSSAHSTILPVQRNDRIPGGLLVDAIEPALADHAERCWDCGRTLAQGEILVRVCELAAYEQRHVLHQHCIELRCQEPPRNVLGPQHAHTLDRVGEAVDALAELNYPGGEFEELIDELAASFAALRAHIDS